MARDSAAALLERSPTLQILLVCIGLFAVQHVIAVFTGWNAAVGLFALAWPLLDRPWAIVTSVYAHSGVGHILSNMLMLLLLGLALERLTTPTRFHLFFLVTGALAGLFQVMLSLVLDLLPLTWWIPLLTTEATAVVGASGAIFALLGYFLTGSRVADGVLDRLGLSPRAQLVLFAALAVVVTVLTASEGVALGGHFFGLFLGLVAGRANLLAVSRDG